MSILHHSKTRGLLRRNDKPHSPKPLHIEFMSLDFSWVYLEHRVPNSEKVGPSCCLLSASSNIFSTLLGPFMNILSFSRGFLLRKPRQSYPRHPPTPFRPTKKQDREPAVAYMYISDRIEVANNCTYSGFCNLLYTAGIRLQSRQLRYSRSRLRTPSLQNPNLQPTQLAGYPNPRQTELKPY